VATHGRNGTYFTVTAPGSFEMILNDAVGGGIDCFFDLAEDPAREYDLAGSSTPTGGFKTLLKMGFSVSGLGNSWFHPDDNHADTAKPTWTGSPRGWTSWRRHRLACGCERRRSSRNGTTTCRCAS
jgi:hypothetical protein